MMLSLFEILFALSFLLKIIVVIKFARIQKDLYLLMYTKKNTRDLTRWLAVMGVASVLLSFFETFRSVIILAYALYILIMFRSKIYNLEDNWITTVLLLFSLQALPEITGVDLSQEALIQFAFLSVAINLTSAGFSKIWSRLWRSGIALKLFFSFKPRLPQTYSWHNRIPDNIWRVCTYIAMGQQLLALPLLLINPYTFIASILGEIVFASFLVFYFRFRYLGELVLIALLYLSGLVLQQARSADLTQLYTNTVYHTPQNGFEFALLFLLFCKCLFVFLSSFPITKHSVVTKIVFYVPRFIFGFVPVTAFTERHLQNVPVPFFYLIQTGTISDYTDQTKASLEKYRVFRIFDNNLNLGEDYDWFSPTALQALQYRFGDMLSSKKNQQKHFQAFGTQIRDLITRREQVSYPENYDLVIGVERLDYEVKQNLVENLPFDEMIILQPVNHPIMKRGKMSKKNLFRGGSESLRVGYQK